MPGAVQTAAPTGVMPYGLAKLFVQSREYPALLMDYVDGSRQISLRGDSSRKAWQITRRLKPADLAILRAYYVGKNGPQIAFYFYDGTESTPPGYYDASGSNSNGRFVVRFDGQFQSSLTPGRSDAAFQLIEIQ